jgi:hypothetical protein
MMPSARQATLHTTTTASTILIGSGEEDAVVVGKLGVVDAGERRPRDEPDTVGGKCPALEGTGVSPGAGKGALGVENGIRGGMIS